MSDKSFYAHIKRDDKVALPVVATGFQKGSGHSAFLALRFGVAGLGQFEFMPKPDEARAIAEAILAAADFADPRVVSAADLGLEAA